jgi:hypothetical protein
VQPITTVFHSQPTMGCSVRRVQTIFASNGLALRIDVPETDKRSSLLSVLVPETATSPLPEVSVFRSAAAAQAAVRGLRSHAESTSALIARQGNVVTVRAAHMAMPVARRLNKVAPVLRANCT